METSMRPGRHVRICCAASQFLTFIIKEAFMPLMIIGHVCNSHTVTCMLFFCSSRAEMGSTPTRSWRTLIFALFTPTPLIPAPLLLPLSLLATHSTVSTICSWVFVYPVERGPCTSFPTFDISIHSAYAMVSQGGLCHFDHQWFVFF